MRYDEKTLSLDTVKQVAAAAETEARRNGWNVLIAIVDDAGHLMDLQREKVQLGSIQVAISKAETALMFRRPTETYNYEMGQGLDEKAIGYDCSDRI